MVGSVEGAAVGLADGTGVGDPGTYVGANVGTPDGAVVGLTVGLGVGDPGV